MLLLARRLMVFLQIKGDKITNLHKLSTLDSVMGGVFIEYNRKLKDLDGLDSLLYIKKTLLIEGNTELDSINAFGLVKEIGGPLILRKNLLLEDCCSFYPLIVADVIKGGTFISNNKACKSEKELRENCDSDTDKDGKDDTDDACPNDPNKIQPGACGCGVAETDSDNDGTPDCNDKCPNDPTKIAAGNCGCGETDKDSDNDGVADCEDECPYNSALTEAGVCGCENPRIVDITIANIGECDDRGTASTLDDIYTVDVTVTFERVPTSGVVLITGHTNAELHFSPASISTSYTLFDLPFKANGRLIEVIATFEGNGHCTKRRVYGIRAPQSCSSGACDPPSNSTVDTEHYLNGALVSWTNLGAGVTYELDYKPLGTDIWVTKSVETNQLLINDLVESTTYDYRIRSVCDGQKESNYLTSQFTTISKECNLTNAIIQNVNCQDNQTPTDASDDYLTFDLTVTGINVSDGFTIDNVVGDSSGQYNTVNSYRTAMGSFGVDSILITITDAADSICQLEAILIEPETCDDDCQISDISLGEVHSCHEGSRFTLNDDFIIADIIVNFKNVPEKGHLRLEGGRFFQSVNVSRLQDRNNYTFRRIIVPTTGEGFSFKAIFSKEKTCVYMGEFAGLTIKEDKLCGEDAARIGTFNTTIANSATVLTIYPNPANETLFLNYRAVTATPVVEIFDLLGQQVMYQIIEGKELNIGHLEKGLYHLVIRDGKDIQTKKFIKE